MIPGADVDREALLCALVLAPFTFARNRFFALFTETWARRTRSRAAMLRTIVRHFSAQQSRAEVRDMAARAEGGVVLRYSVRHLGLERTAMLEPHHRHRLVLVAGHSLCAVAPAAGAVRRDPRGDEADR